MTSHAAETRNAVVNIVIFSVPQKRPSLLPLALEFFARRAVECDCNCKMLLSRSLHSTSTDFDVLYLIGTLLFEQNSNVSVLV